MSLRLYISGPMTGCEDYNFPAFEAAAVRLRALGHSVVTPHELDSPEELEALKAETESGDPYGPAYEAFLARDVDLLETAELDGIVCLQGWQHSRGVARELEVGFGKGLKAWKFNYATGLGEPIAAPAEKVTEVRIVNSETGGEKGRKPQRFDLLPWAALASIAEVYDYGCNKYAARNWERGYDWSLSFGACLRHLSAFWQGEDADPESGLPHLAHAAFHLLALLTFMERHRDLDDRPEAA